MTKNPLRGFAPPGPRRRSRRTLPGALVLWLAAAGTPGFAEPPLQTDADHYTRYELLEPASGRFRILYEVSATTPGARAYFNPIRPGSAAFDESAWDRASGRRLELAVVDAATARAGGVRDAEEGTEFIRVGLPRPVPADGEVRLLIDKTYEDRASYHGEGDRLVFERQLGIRRNAVVLPAGWEPISCNVPVQVRTEPDGRVALSFVRLGPDPASLRIEARRLP